MEMKEFFEIFEKSIFDIFDPKTNEHLPFKSIAFKYEAPKSKIQELSKSMHIYIDGEYLKNCRRWKFKYICRCGKEQEIWCSKLIAKIERGKEFWCQSCMQKSKYGSRFVANPYGTSGKKFHPDEYCKQEEPLKINFNDESEQFKKQYALRPIVFSYEKFNETLANCYSLNNILQEDLKDHEIKLNYAVPSHNQQKYTQHVMIDGKDEGIHFKMKCSMCGNIINPHIDNLVRSKDLSHYLCRDCALSNKTYPIQIYEPLNIKYQSNLELKFIKRCEELKIDISRGPNIPYI